MARSALWCRVAASLSLPLAISFLLPLLHSHIIRPTQQEYSALLTKPRPHGETPAQVHNMSAAVAKRSLSSQSRSQDSKHRHVEAAIDAAKQAVRVAAAKKKWKATSTRPVVFVIADDLRADSIVKVPNLSALKAASISFDRAYCQTPACNPSRNSFLTGVMPDVSKVFGFEATTKETMGSRGTRSFFSELKMQGFASYGVGKIYHWEPFGDPFSTDYACLEDHTRRCQFEYYPEVYNQEWGCNDDACKPSECRVAYNKGNTCYRRDIYLAADSEELFDAKVTREATKYLWIGARDYFQRQVPFVLGIGFHNPHLEWRIPRRLFAMQNATAAIHHLPPQGAPQFAFGDIAVGSQSELELVDGTVVNGDQFYCATPTRRNMPRMPEAVARELRAGYGGAVAFLDEQVGTLINEAKSSMLWDEAVVIFTSDHGYGLGEHGHWGKSSLYEVDCRVPLLVRDPQLTMGRASMAVVELLDIGKTILDLSGSPFTLLSVKLPGRSLRRLLSTESAYDHEWNHQRRIATTMISRCLHKPAVPFLCPGRSYLWPQDAIVGYAARSTHFRYVAWMSFNASIDSVNWSQRPIAEELYAYANVFATSDDWDRQNLMAVGSSYSNEYRVVANRHFSWLRSAARRRQNGAVS